MKRLLDFGAQGSSDELPGWNDVQDATTHLSQADGRSNEPEQFAHAAATEAMAEMGKRVSIKNLLLKFAKTHTNPSSDNYKELLADYKRLVSGWGWSSDQGKALFLDLMEQDDKQAITPAVWSSMLLMLNRE